VDTTWIVAASLSVAWIFSVLFQLGDLGTSTIDEGTARDREVRGRVSRERARGLYWVLPLGSVVIVGTGIGIDFISRLLFDLREPMFALLFAFVLVAVISGAALVIGVGIVLDTPSGYRELRDELHSVGERRISREELIGLRRWLASIDGRLPRGQLADPVTIGAAVRFLFGRGAARLVPVALGLAVTVSVILAATGDARWSWLIVAGCLAPVLSGGLALAGSHAFLTAEVAWRHVLRAQRQDVVRALEVLERGVAKRNTGLAERVGRALQILREQQGQ
jgi:hypothetical protein